MKYRKSDVLGPHRIVVTANSDLRYSQMGISLSITKESHTRKGLSWLDRRLQGHVHR